MLLTFGQLAGIVAPFLGRSGACDLNDQATRLNIAALLQEYIFRAGSIATWKLTTHNNTFTLPRDLAVILKVKINGVTETAFSPWYEFFDGVGAQDHSCRGEEWASGVIQDVNNFPTVYDLPCEGGYVLAELGRKCSSKLNPGYTIIQGIDKDGNDVYTKHKGENIHGERLDLESGVAKRSNVFFKKITAITKSQTDDYVKYLYQTDKTKTPRSLSLLAAKETVANFRRARIIGDKCLPEHKYSISVLGRVEIFSDYHDNDIIPLKEIAGIKNLAQANQSTSNNNIEAAGFKYQLTDAVITNANEYQRNTDSTLDYVHDLSPGSIDHLI